MSVTLESVEKINALKQGIEATTGETYADLTEGVQALKNGYSQGGGGTEEIVGMIFLEYDETFHGLPSKVKWNYKSSLPRKEKEFEYLFYSTSTSSVFSRMKEVYLPDGLDWISESMFEGCGQLNTIHADFSKVEHIGVDAFKGCKSLTEFPYLPMLNDLRPNAFSNCTGLTVVKFYTELSVLASNNAFSGCTNIIDIYVPWAEGAITNAPWGATNENLQIHYNTTYDENHNPIV